jgi:hypothetical protein
MPGGHSTAVFRAKTEVGLIATFLAHHFVQKHGTQLTTAIRLTPLDLCELYAKIRMSIADYRSMGGGFLQLLGRGGRVVQNPFQGTSYFINDHHASQFRKIFPQVWAALDRGVSHLGRTIFLSELRMLQSNAPTTYLSLQSAGIV